MKKTATSTIILGLVILLGIFQLTREIFGLGTWQSRGYIERYKGMENLLPFLLESPGIWIIICGLSYYNIHKKGGQLLWGQITAQFLLFLSMCFAPMAKMLFILVWLLFAQIIYYGYKSRPQDSTPDILDDPDF
jgi:hypothetical protein